MKLTLRTILFHLLFLVGVTALSDTDEFVVYSVYQTVSLESAKAQNPKDYYISMGYQHGLKKGAILEVMRRIPSFDTSGEKLYREVIFPIALIKVIHVESKSAIARLEKLLPVNEVPISMPRAVAVGDVVRPAKN